MFTEISFYPDLDSGGYDSCLSEARMIAYLASSTATKHSEQEDALGGMVSDNLRLVLLVRQ
jgi:hypothetical protein